jgi:4-amino-4-deoxy-L-arabinose transferase-like glycosyltransferase
MSRRLLYPALLALPFLAGVALLHGLTVEVHTFHGNDARLYHLPTILQFSHGIDLKHYPAAQTPLYHLLFAGWGKVVGFEPWRLRLLNVALSYAAVVVLFRLLVQRRLGELAAFVLALLFALSPYYLGASFTLLTDNLALLFALLALGRLDRFGRDEELRDFALACLAMAAAVLTRQSFLWLALVAAVYLARSRWPLERKALGAAIGAAALVPLAVLVAVWGGLVPPGSDPASCGLCADRDPLTLRTVGFTLALFGVYATIAIGPSLTRRVRAMRRSRALRMAARVTGLALPWRRIAVAAGAGVVVILLSPLAYKPLSAATPGDAGWLWKLSDKFPELLGSSLVFWVLVPLGTASFYLLVRRNGPLSLPAVFFGAVLLAALPVGLVYQKYFDPLALAAVALFARDEDLDYITDYGGIALACVAFAAYALTF